MATRRRRRVRRTANSHPIRRRRVTRRRRANPAVRYHRRRRASVGHRRRRTRRNPSVRTVVRYRNRSRRHGRRRNLGRSNRMGSTFTVVGGILGGAALTSFIGKMLPAQIHSGILGIAANAVVAIIGGKMVGKVFKSPSLGRYMQYGGLVYVGMQVLNQFFPSLGGYIPFGLNGLGLIAPSSFYTPQVNAPGSMGTFLTPASVSMAMPSSLKGLQPGGAFNRRGARMA